MTYSLQESDVVTAVSESLKKDTYSFFNYSGEIYVVPNFIDFERFNKQPKDHFKKGIAPNGEKILVHTSNFRKVKRTPVIRNGENHDVFEMISFTEENSFTELKLRLTLFI